MPLGRIELPLTRIRNPVLYPLSYRGGSKIILRPTKLGFPCAQNASLSFTILVSINHKYKFFLTIPQWVNLVSPWH